MKWTAWIVAAWVAIGTVVWAGNVDMVQVDSSFIEKIGFDAEKEILYVQLHNTLDVYTYTEVPQSVYEEFLSAESKGRYFVENIKGQFVSGGDE